MMARVLVVMAAVIADASIFWLSTPTSTKTGMAPAFTMTDADAMTPQARLSGYDVVSVSARISLSGDVAPQPGDMIAEITDIPTKGLSQPLEIVVSEVVK